MSIKFLVLGGGILGLGGGKCRFYFYGRGDFSDFNKKNKGDQGHVGSEIGSAQIANHQ